jgi:uncharacterized membrane protein
MDFLKGNYDEITAMVCNKCVGIYVGSIALVYIVFKIYSKISRSMTRAAYPKDVVILHQFPIGLRVPRLDPSLNNLKSFNSLN